MATLATAPQPPPDSSIRREAEKNQNLFFCFSCHIAGKLLGSDPVQGLKTPSSTSGETKGSLGFRDARSSWRCNRTVLLCQTPSGTRAAECQLRDFSFLDSPAGQRRRSQKTLVGVSADRCLLLTELVRLRFQQSGFSLFCSSASALAWSVKTRRSSLRIFFHLSPRRTLMALRADTR